MNRKLILADLKSNVQKVSHVISLLENYDSSNAGVELDLMQKNVAILFENYVKLKLSYELDEKNTSFELIPKPIEIVAAQKPSPLIEKIVEVVEKPKEPIKPSFGFNFNLGDDEGKINRNFESNEEKEIRPDNPNFENKIKEAMANAFNRPTTKVTEEQNIVQDTDRDLTLNERFSSLRKDINLADTHLNTPIKDLTKEISLNKKFAFVNELFEGDMERYNQAIQNLNNIGSMEFANKYLNELKVTLRWDKENSAVSEFIDLVERRW